MVSEFKEKSGKVTAPCYTHPIASFGYDTYHFIVSNFFKSFDI